MSRRTIKDINKIHIIITFNLESSKSINPPDSEWGKDIHSQDQISTVLPFSYPYTSTENFLY